MPVKGVLRDYDDKPQNAVLPEEPQGNTTSPIAPDSTWSVLVPEVNEFNTCVLEALDVPGGHGEPMCRGCCSDIPVCNRNWVADGPGRHGHVRITPCSFLIERKHSAGVWSRTASSVATSSSVRSRARPREARALPSRMRRSGTSAALRISRTSASALRPCCVARTRSARCASSGTFRTVKTAIMSPLCRGDSI